MSPPRTIAVAEGAVDSNRSNEDRIERVAEGGSKIAEDGSKIAESSSAESAERESMTAEGDFGPGNCF